jgi:tetratricopeptide (TPR) repeat protein
MATSATKNISAPPMKQIGIRPGVALIGVLLLVTLVYASHFGNTFHFDDSHTVTENPWIRDLRNIPRFFTDGATFSTLPPNRSYRPIVSTSLAIDYWLGHGLHPVWFQTSTFLWFLAQLALMYPLFRITLDRVQPNDRNPWIALLGVTIYGLHPVMAETVNYVIQRGDVYSTAGVVAGLAMYIALPRLRRYGLYLLPVVVGILSKSPAAVFPALLFLWIWLFDEENLVPTAIRSLPAFVVCGATALFVVRMTPPTFTAGSSSPFLYRISQPWVLLGYLRKFFVPTGLTADTDEMALPGLGDDRALFGFLFVIVVIGLFFLCARRRALKPIAFGLAWFLIASIPTSAIALAEIENDHRMYFPFVGLALAVCWPLALWLRAVARPKQPLRVPNAVLAPALALALGALAWGTVQRNRVWATDEALWRDVTIKSPRNGRGLMNYGLTLMSKGKMADALEYFNRALVYNPAYYILEINLGIAYGGVGKPVEAEQHFKRAIFLEPGEAMSHFYYARWLSEQRRNAEAIAEARATVKLNPDYVAADYLLMQLDGNAGDAAALRADASAFLARFPGDATAQSWLARAENPVPPQAPLGASADAFVLESLNDYRAGKFRECVDAAQRAVEINPNYAEAWNNIGACQNALGHWAQGIEAEQRAIRLKPDFQLARNNLAYALSQKNKPK